MYSQAIVPTWHRLPPREESTLTSSGANRSSKIVVSMMSSFAFRTSRESSPSRKSMVVSPVKATSGVLTCSSISCRVLWRFAPTVTQTTSSCETSKSKVSFSLFTHQTLCCQVTPNNCQEQSYNVRCCSVCFDVSYSPGRRWSCQESSDVETWPPSPSVTLPSSLSLFMSLPGNPRYSFFSFFFNLLIRYPCTTWP